jgi:multidrug efflux pump subunit AcrB
LGQTLNITTLGGLALAVGILVDDATVTIENIHRNLAMGKSLVDGILDGADQIATPAFVATLSICIVFFPIFLRRWRMSSEVSSQKTRLTWCSPTLACR